MMPATYILTCEHAGNEIPATYEHLFKGKEEILYSHQAIDFGALHLAKHLAAATNLPLYYTTTSRLLIEANRSLDNEELFSAFTKNIPEKEKQTLREAYYFPHRDQVEKKIAAEIAAGKQVYHLAVHTFTPVLKGEVRAADIGILFDPERESEAAFARQLQTALSAQNPDRKVLFNSPYPGTADGFPTYLRKKFNQDQYAGFELEINQKFFLNGEPDVWQGIESEITGALQACMSSNI
jgi:predicted N-formylglutamate amidohydrolase